MRRHVLALALLVPVLSGCSSMLNIGHNSFRCEGTDKGGVCAPVDKVYNERYKLGGQKDTVIDKESGKQKDDKKDNMQNTKAEITVKVVKDKTDTEPVRIPPKIAKVWIEPYVDYKGNLLGGRYVYLIVKEGGWLLPDGSVIYDEEAKAKEGKNDN